MIKLARIVCPTDFSPTSSHAVDYAASLADGLKAELVLLHAMADMHYPLRGYGMSQSFEHIQEELEQRTADTLKARIEKLREHFPDLKISTDVRHGTAHELILECAKDKDADMIVMGTHGHTGLTHALLGSTAEKVVRTSACPVLTVRTPS